MKNENIEKSDEVVWLEFSFIMMRFIYIIGLFIIFLLVSDLKIRAICCLTMTLPSLIEFICKKVGTKVFKF